MDYLTASQIAEWEAYDKLDPIGTWREDYRMAYLACTFTNLTISVHGKKGAKHTTPMEFLPDWGEDQPMNAPKVQSVEEMKQVMLALKGNTNVKPNRRALPSNRAPHKHYGP